MATYKAPGVSKSASAKQPWRFRKMIDGIRKCQHFTSLKKANAYAKSFKPSMFGSLSSLG
jgi:hypothetical protein